MRSARRGKHQRAAGPDRFGVGRARPRRGHPGNGTRRRRAEGELPRHATDDGRHAAAAAEGGSVVAVASTAALGWDQRLEILAGLLELTDAEAVEKWQASQDPNYPVYSTSKQAVILYSKRLAGPAWTKYRVRINTVSPGPVETPILFDFEQTMGKDVLDIAAPPSAGTRALTTSCPWFRSSGHPRSAGSRVRTFKSTVASSAR